MSKIIENLVNSVYVLNIFASSPLAYSFLTSVPPPINF